jgi:hypothetical protein
MQRTIIIIISNNGCISSCIVHLCWLCNWLL